MTLLVLLVVACRVESTLSGLDVGPPRADQDDTGHPRLDTGQPDTGGQHDTAIDETGQAAFERCPDGILGQTNAYALRLEEEAPERFPYGAVVGFAAAVRSGTTELDEPGLWISVIDAPREERGGAFLVTFEDILAQYALGLTARVWYEDSDHQRSVWLGANAVTASASLPQRGQWFASGLGEDDEYGMHLFNSAPSEPAHVLEAETTITGVTTPLAADFDADGLDDVIAMHGMGSDVASVFMAPLAESYIGDEEADRYVSGFGIMGSTNYPYFADVDHDGTTDMLVHGRTSDDSGSYGYVDVYLGPLFTTDELADPAMRYLSEAAVTLAYGAGDTPNLQEGQGISSVGDLTGDGLDDIAVNSDDDRYGDTDSGAVFVLGQFETGAWSLAEQAEAILVNPTSPERGHGWAPRTIRAGDLNGDGDADIVVDNFADGDELAWAFVVTGPRNGVVPLEGEAAQVLIPFNVPRLYHNLEPAGDLDQDGRDDFVVSAPMGWGSVPGVLYLFPGCESW